MDVFFYLIPGLIMTVALFMGYRVVYRSIQVRRAWNSGLTAQGRCLRMYTTTHGGSNDSRVRTTLHHVYEFTTHDGRPIRFEEEDGPGTTVEGDVVTVYYVDGLDVVATAHRPAQVKQAAATVFMLAFLGVVVAFCIGFMITFSQMSEQFGFGEDTGDTVDTVVVDGVTITP